MMSRFCSVLLIVLFFGSVKAQPDFKPNYDEAKIPAYNLPELMETISGKQVNKVTEWENFRRPELLSLFETYVYGKIPEMSQQIQFEVVESSDQAIGGKAIRKQVKASLSQGDSTFSFHILIYLPKNKLPAPVFVGLNFYGNQTIQPDPAILISEAWARDNAEFGVENNRATEKSRGVRIARWPVKEIIGQGYGLATIYYGELDPDYDDGFQNGIQPWFYRPGQTHPEPDEWGAIGAWAWGLSRAMDYFEQDNQIDSRKVAVMGHSRLGKAALYAGAVDERFAMVISNDSGCGGAALSRRAIGETVGRINRAFPHWFGDNFNRFNENEQHLPVDQHQLIALVAPRPVYVASAEDDLWADPKGEFLAAQAASPAYELYGKKALSGKDMPEVQKPLQDGSIGYHIRTGKHDVTLYDWQQYMNFANRHFK